MDKDKAGSGSIVGIDENRTAEDDGNLVTDCQSESGAFFLAEFFESIEDLSLFVGRNAGTDLPALRKWGWLILRSWISPRWWAGWSEFAKVSVRRYAACRRHMEAWKSSPHRVRVYVPLSEWRADRCARCLRLRIWIWCARIPVGKCRGCRSKA